MPHYFYPIQAERFANQITPILAECWRQKSFSPAGPWCQTLLPRIRTYTQGYGQMEGPTLVEMVLQGLSFSRPVWRSLVGEVLLFSAQELPLLQVPIDTWYALENISKDNPRGRFGPLQQALWGSRDLVFGGGFYRPDWAGWNSTNEVERLALYLTNADTREWTEEKLISMAGMESKEERQEEIEFARQGWNGVAEVYRKAALEGCVMVCEGECS